MPVEATKSFASYFATTLDRSIDVYNSTPSCDGEAPETFLLFLDRVFRVKKSLASRSDHVLDRRIEDLADQIEFRSSTKHSSAKQKYYAAYASLFLDFNQTDTKAGVNNAYLIFLKANPVDAVWNSFEESRALSDSQKPQETINLIKSLTLLAQKCRNEYLEDKYSFLMQNSSELDIKARTEVNTEFSRLAENLNSEAKRSVFDNLISHYFSEANSPRPDTAQFLDSLYKVFASHSPFFTAEEARVLNEVIDTAVGFGVKDAFSDHGFKEFLHMFVAQTFSKRELEIYESFIEPIKNNSDDYESFKERLFDMSYATYLLGENKSDEKDVEYIQNILTSPDLEKDLQASLDLLCNYVEAPQIRKVLELDSFKKVFENKGIKELSELFKRFEGKIKKRSFDKSMSVYKLLISHMDFEKYPQQLEEALQILESTLSLGSDELDFFLSENFKKKVLGPIKAYSKNYAQDLKDVLQEFAFNNSSWEIEARILEDLVETKFDHENISKSAHDIKFQMILDTYEGDLNLGDQEYFRWRLDRLASNKLKRLFLQDLSRTMKKLVGRPDRERVLYELVNTKTSRYFQEKGWDNFYSDTVENFNILDLCDSLKELKVPDQSLLNFEDALDQALYKEPYQVGEAIANMSQFQKMFHGGDLPQSEDFYDLVQLGHHPFRPETSQEQQAYGQSFEVLKNNYTRSRSSVQDAYAFRRVGNDKKVQYLDFIQDFLKVKKKSIENEGWKDESFPGNGYIFGDFKLTEPIKLFTAIATWHLPPEIDREEMSWEEQVQTGMQRSRNLLASLEKSRIYRLRGATIIKPRENDRKFYLMSSKGERESFSYVFFNEHYANPTNSTAFLVPTHMLEGVETAEELAELIAPKKLSFDDKVLNLGSSLAIAGSGLSAARAYGSAPYHQAETEYTEYRDAANRHHYSSTSWGWHSEWGPVMEEKTKPFREDHKAIVDLAFKFDTMIRQLDHLESLHMMGYNNLDDNRQNTGIGQEPSLPGNMDYAFSLYDAWAQEYENKPDDGKGFKSVLVDAGVEAKGSDIKGWRFKLDPVEGKFYERASVNAKPTVKDIKGSREIIERKILSYMREGHKEGVYNTMRFVPESITV